MGSKAVSVLFGIMLIPLIVPGELKGAEILSAATKEERIVIIDRPVRVTAKLKKAFDCEYKFDLKVGCGNAQVSSGDL